MNSLNEMFPLARMFPLAVIHKGFEKKTKVNVKIDDVIDWERGNYNRLPNISRSNDNQAIRKV